MNQPTTITGVVLRELAQVADRCGPVLHMLRMDDPEFVRFGECYFSELLPGAVKAWRYHHRQTQNLAVPAGRVRLVIYDERASSDTRGLLQAMELGRPDAYRRVRIPPGLWYGFACLGAAPALIANCADLPHDPADREKRAPDDPRIPHRWSVE